jgi:hypothetical protein
MYAITNAIIVPASDLLQSAVNALQNANLVAAQGLSGAGTWLGPITYLGPGWQAALASALAAAALVVAVRAALGAYRFYLSLKQGVKWW